MGNVLESRLHDLGITEDYLIKLLNKSGDLTAEKIHHMQYDAGYYVGKTYDEIKLLKSERRLKPRPHE